MAIRWLGTCVLVLMATVLLGETRPGTSKKTGSRPDSGKSEPGKSRVGVKDFDGFSFEPPAEWRPLVIQKTMRVARYALPSPSEKHRSGELIVFHFKNGAGSADDNITRWTQQFDKEEGVSDEDFTQVSKQTVDGMKVSILEIRGLYKGTQMGTTQKAEPGQMMLAAVIETEAGFYYVRTLGPVATIEHWKNAWYRMMLSLKAKKKSK